MRVRLICISIILTCSLSGCALYDKVASLVPDEMIELDSEKLDEKQSSEMNMYVVNHVSTWPEYAYSQLDNTNKSIYDEIYYALLNRTKVSLSTTDMSLIKDVFECVMLDHPDIYYVDGYTTSTYSSKNVVTRIELEPAISMSELEAQSYQQAIDEYVRKWKSGITELMTQYEIVKYTYEFIIEHTTYRLEAPNNQNICSVFCNGYSVCQGYAKAFQYLMHEAGIWCTLVTGSTVDGIGHAWNMVKIEGGYYHVDVTWGDSFYQVVSESSVTKLPSINYDYLCTTTQDLMAQHIIDAPIAMPVADSVTYNYFVREGMYITEVSDAKMREVFVNFGAGTNVVSIKCASREIYNVLYSELIEKNKLFNYILNDNLVSFTTNERGLVLTFWTIKEN